MTGPRIDPNPLRRPLLSVDDEVSAELQRVAGWHAAQQQRATTSLELAKQTPAPTARANANVARAYGIDPASAPARLMAPDSHAELIRQDSALAVWLSNPIKAAQVQDDLPSMAAASWLLKQSPMTIRAPSMLQRSVTAFGASWKMNTDVVDARFEQMVSGATSEQNALLNAQSDALARQQMDPTATAAAVDAATAGLPSLARFGANVVRNATVTAPSMIRGILDAGTGAAIGGTLGAAAGLAGGPFAEVTVPAGAAAGAQAGALAGGFLSSMRAEGAMTLDGLMRSTTVAGNAISERSARAQAWGVGLVNGLLETVGNVFLVNALPGVRSLLPQSLIPSMLRTTAAQAVERAVTQRTARGAVIGFAKSMGASIAEEASTEALQSIAPGLSNIALNVANPDGSAYSVADIGADMLDSATQAAQAMLVLGFPPAFANYAGQHVRAARATATAEYFSALSETMRRSKALTEAPDTVGELLRAAAPDAPTVYVPAEAWATFFQSSGVAPEQAAQTILGDAGQYLTAQQLGGYVAIPMDVYATKLAASPFHDAVSQDLKTNLNDWSAREAAAKAAELQDPAVVSRLLEEMQAALPQPAEGEEAVRQNVSAQLQAAGVQADQAAPLAQLHALVYRSLADRSAQSVADVASQRVVQIVGGRQAAAMLRGDVYASARTPAGALRSNASLARTETPALVRELLAAYSANGAENIVGRAVDSEQQLSAGGSSYVGTEGSMRAEGRVAARKKGIARLEAALVARGMTPAQISEAMAAESDRVRTDAAVQAEIDRLASQDIYQGDALAGLEADALPDVADDGTSLNAAGELVDAAGNVLFQMGMAVDGEHATFHQDDANPNGYIRFSPDGYQVTIGLLNLKNPSTFIHESAHLFVDMLLTTAAKDTASEALKADAQTIREWLGLQPGETLGPDQRDKHEQFARAFESYWATATAPRADLAALFGRFRAWIVSVYHSATGLNIPISEEVRGVFDRLVAGESAIAAADVRAGQLTDAAQVGGSADDFAAYQQRASVAYEAFAAKLQAQLRNETLRASRAEWRMEFDRRSDALRAELLGQPVYQAQAALRDGEKLSRAWVEAQFGAEARKTLTQRKLTTTDTGIDPTLFAIEYGFATEDELIAALLTAPPIDALVREQVGASMARDYGDLLHDGNALAQAARSVAHDAADDGLARVLVEELTALGHVRGLDVPSRADGVTFASLKRLARDTIAKQTAATIRPHGYFVAERQAAREVEAALVAGNQQGAYLAKRRQLLNHLFYAEAIAAQNEMRDARRELLRYTQPAVRAKIGKIGQPWLEQIDGLLERVDLKQRTRTEWEARADLARWITEKTAEGDPIVAALGLGTETPAIPFQSLTVQQTRDLRDAVLMLGTGAAREGKALALTKQHTQDELRTKLMDELDRTGQVAPDRGDAMSSRARFATAARERFATLRTLPSIVRQIGGGNETGDWWQYVLRPLNEAGTEEARQNREAAVALARVNALLTPADRKALATTAPVRLSTGVVVHLTLRQRLAVVLNTGTEGNQQRLRDGNQIGDGEQQRLRESLTDSQLRWVQGVWDYLDSFWPATEALAKRIDGIAPEKVEAIPFVVRGTQYRGGYYRLKYDPTQSAQIQSIDLESQQRDFARGVAHRGSTRNGSRIERVQSASYAVRLDLLVIGEHVREVIHDLTHQEIIRDLNAVLFRAPDVGDRAIATVGPELWEQIKSALTDVTVNGRPAGPTDAIAETLNRKVSLVRMGFNVMTALMQPTGFLSTSARIGYGWTARGLLASTGSLLRLNQSNAMVLEKSAFMRERQATVSRDAMTALRATFEIEPKQAFDRGLAEYAYRGIALMQTVVDLPSWIGAYQKAISAGTPEAEAVLVADQAVIDSQGNGMLKDQAQVMRLRGWARLWTAMYSYMNTQYNLIASSGRLALRDGTRGEQVAAITNVVLLTVVLPSVLTKLLRDALRGDEPPDNVATSYLAEIAAYALSLVPLGREVSGMMQGYGDYDGPAGAGVFASIGKLKAQTDRIARGGDVTPATLRAANETAGLLFGYPATQLDRTVRGITALIDGTTSNPLAPLIGPPRHR